MKIERLTLKLGYLCAVSRRPIPSTHPGKAGVGKLPSHACSADHQDWSGHKLVHLEGTPEEVNSNS